MKKSLLLPFGLSAIILMSVVSAFGQDSAPRDDRAQIERSMVRTAQTMVGPAGQGPESRASTLYWMESEFSFDGKTVKGSPYSAEAVTESTQALSDGNRIVNRSSSMLYRDSEGRTRREQSLNFVGNLAAGPSVKTVMINDPIAGMTYSLDPESRTARKSRMFHFEITPRAATGGSDVTVNQAQAGAAVRVNSGGGVTVSAAPTVTFKSTPAGTFTFALEGDQKNVVKESLGSQVIEGVDAEGTRTTITIPAGTIGNEKPIAIVDERWYSPSLQTVVMTKHSDPRTGENVYRLTNINRTEPDHSLFEVPADYQVKDLPTAVLPEMRMRKPEEQ